MSQGIHLRKYGVEGTIDFELYEVDGINLRTDWTPAAADCEVMKDGGDSTQCTNTAVDEGSMYSITLTATEMQAARIVLKIVDAATKVFLDKVIIIETYGNASAQHAMDFDDAVRGGMTALPAAAADAAGGLPISDTGGLDLDAQLANTNEVTAARMGALTDWINGGRLDAILDIIAADTTTDIPALIATAQADLDIITGATGVNLLAATQASIDAIEADTNELQSDDIPTLIAALPTAAEVNAEVDTALADIHLDHLLAADYDPAAKPGVATALLNELVENDGGISRFTANALENGPGGAADPQVVATGTIGSTGNSTTTLHLVGLTQGNDELNDLLIRVYDDSTGEYHSRWILGWVLATELATVAALPFTPEDAVDTYVVLSARQDVTGGSGLDAAGVRAAVGLAAANLDTQLGTIVADTNELQIDDVPGLIATAQADLDIITGATGVNLLAATQASIDAIEADTNELQADDYPTSIAAIKAETALIVADTNELQTDDVPGLIGALNNLSTADVNAEVDTALTDIHLDHLLAAAYDPTAKPGAADALLNELVENDGGVSRFTANALEQAPSGAGGDATQAKQDAIIAAIGTPANIDAGGATLADNLKKIADDNGGADFDATSDSLAAGGSGLTAQQVADALMADTGFTAGGTMTYADYLKYTAAWLVGAWRLKSGTTNTYEILDPDDGATVICEATPNASTGIMEVTLS